MTSQASKIVSSIKGLAYGDAWGWPMEFMPYQRIAELRLQFLERPIITDDTQMSIAAISPILADSYNLQQFQLRLHGFTVADQNYFRVLFAESFITWSHDPDNTRAPGITCMESLASLEGQRPFTTGLEGTSNWSKGCGANMRAPWFGLLSIPEQDVVRLAVLQASVTHNPPMALAATALTSVITQMLLMETANPENLFEVLLEKTMELQKADNTWSPNYEAGLPELYDYLVSARDKFTEALSSDHDTDVCSFLGEGKIAEEALLLAVFAVQRYGFEAVKGLERLTQTSGDSDSIAAIGGAFFGAAYGQAIWPQEWFGMLEPRYQQELTEVMLELVSASIAIPIFSNP
jgi:ADP-ribosylglycohydrolase